MAAWRRLVLIGLLLALPGCGDALVGGALLPPLAVDSVGPEAIVPGTRLTIAGRGFVVAEVGDLVVVIEGELAGAPLYLEAAPLRLDDRTLVVPVEGHVADALLAVDGPLTGRLTVHRRPRVDAPEDAATLPLSLTTHQTLSPTLVDLAPRTLYLGEEVTVTGGGFLHPSEGLSLVELSGVMVTLSPARSLAIDGLSLPAAPPAPTRRDALAFTLTPDVLGILPGTFRGELRVVNAHRDGTMSASQTLAIEPLTLAAPYVASVDPEAASRGQWVMVSGRGFAEADGLAQVATVLELSGQFVGADGALEDYTGPRALAVVPDLVEGNHLLGLVLHVSPGPDGELAGLGVAPGRFTGTAAPLLFFGPDVLRGDALALSFDILPQRQMVYLKLLPAFDEALSEFGLLAEKAAVIDRIHEVVARDYAGVNIGFTRDPPAGFAEYSVVEIAGRDPNGTGLFGLDNTAGKDEGNLRFDDVIGGYNAETDAAGYAAYGGIFPAEFRSLSPSLGSHPLASARFDDIFAPVMPALGGRPAKQGEAAEAGRRGEQIREAVRVFANLVGHTVSHEVGHSLGLAAIDGQFHNIGDNPGWIMDAGLYRPFEERGEVDGEGPAFFSPNNRAYLERILPL